MEKKLVAYYKVGNKYDTPLDSIDVQRKRINSWCEEFGFSVIDEFIDTEVSGRSERLAAFQCSDTNKVKVVVASVCRLADVPLEMLKLKKDKKDNDTFMSVEFGELSNLGEESVMKAQVDFMMTNIMGLREKYLSDCEKFVA